MECRRNWNENVGHFCINCSGWPKDNTKYEVANMGFSRPYSRRYSLDEVCEECLARRDKNRCRTF